MKVSAWLMAGLSKTFPYKRSEKWVPILLLVAMYRTVYSLHRKYKTPSRYYYRLLSFGKQRIRNSKLLLVIYISLFSLRLSLRAAFNNQMQSYKRVLKKAESYILNLNGWLIHLTRFMAK